MNIEDCKEGAKVRWDFDGETDFGIIVKYNGSIWVNDSKNSVWSTWDATNHRHPLYVELKNLTLVEPQKQSERKYSKEEIIEYMESIGYLNVETNIQGLDDYFTSDNEEERKAIKLLKSKGYTVQK